MSDNSNKHSIRKTDTPFNDPVQTSRFVEIGGNWFFLTRERDLQGPFASRQSAETALAIYLTEEVSRREGRAPQGGQEGPEGYEVEETDLQATAATTASHKASTSGNVISWRSAKTNLL